MFDDTVCALMLVNYAMNGGVALCLGGYEEQLTQEEYDLRKNAIKVVKQHENSGNIYDWATDDADNFDDDIFTEDEELPEELFEEYPEKRGYTRVIEV
jgi:hypothetical protein